MDYYGFYTGKVFDAYRYLGAHAEREGVTFRTFAPSAQRISLIGEFSSWEECPMHKVYDGNFWECYIPDARPGMMYKYRIYQQSGFFIDHCDPYGYGMELRPKNASIIRDLSTYHFKDSKWMEQRTDHRNQPLNIYELHFGSWKKPSEEEEDWYSYTELADILLPYLKENGYNYLEIMPLSEHPCDESWGYQNTGFYSPTSRYGTAQELMEFIDACHQNDIGIIMDFVPVHFAVDGYALANYDGTALYEYPNIDVGRSEWGSCNFMHSRGEVRSFLQSAANYWLTDYHVDGIRMDAISNIIYWQGDPARGVNKSAVDFIREMNRGLKQMHPSAILSAEDSTSYPGVTKSTAEGGLGFDYKWDMGWMNDTLEYFRTAPQYRTRDYHKLTFSMHYFYSDSFLLPLSHDEVVHGKATILQKMHGEYEEKFPQARALYINFMGNEFGQLREWDEKREQDWDILKYPIHDAFHRFMKDLNRLYLKHPSLSSCDYVPEGFAWLDCHQEERCIYAFLRTDGKERIAAVFNLSDQVQEGYRLPVKGTAQASILLASDMEEYAGGRKYEDLELAADHGAIQLDLSPYSALYLLLQ